MWGRSVGAGSELKPIVSLAVILLLGGCETKATPPTPTEAAQAALVRLDTEARRHVRPDDAMRRDAGQVAPMKLDMSAVRPLLDGASVLPEDGATRATTASGAGMAPEAVLPDGQELHIDARHHRPEDEAAPLSGKVGGRGAASIDIPNADGSITHVEPDGTVRTEKLISRTRPVQGSVGHGR